MKKWIGLIMIVVISSSPIKASEVNNSTYLIEDEINQSEAFAPYLSRQFFNTVLEEQHLPYLIESFSDKEVTLKEVAYALCQMINEPGVYLPEAEGINDPYIGKLIILGIWQEAETTEESLITNEAWNRTYERLLVYQEDRQALIYSDSSKQKKISHYREQIQKKTSFEPIQIGKLALSSQTVTYGGYTYPLYTFLNTNYIHLGTLEAMGFSLEKQPQGDILKLDPNKIQGVWSSQEKSIDVSLANTPIYYDSLRTYALQSKEGLFIPLRALEIGFDLTGNGTTWYLEKSLVRESNLAYREGRLYNISEMPIEILTTSYYWNGKQMIQETKKQHIESNQSMEDPNTSYRLRGAIYLNTLINEVITNEGSRTNQKGYGQQMESLLKNYEKAIQAEIKQKEEQQKEIVAVETLFPPAPVYATLRSATKGLKKGEQVELYREDSGSYTVITKENKKVVIPKKELMIPNDQKVTALPASKVQIETYINKQNVESSTNYLVWTDLHRQTTYVLKGSKNQWELIRRMICSTGKNQTPTPRGFFTLQNKVTSFGEAKGYSCKNAYGFIGSSYLYHSILFDKTGTYIIAGKKELGQKASHGCIRLQPEDSLWLYNTMPKGTKVWIN